MNLDINNVELIFFTLSAELLKEKRMNRCLATNGDCVMSWELDRNQGHRLLSQESCGASMGHPGLAEPGFAPFSTPGTVGKLNWRKERVND